MLHGSAAGSLPSPRARSRLSKTGTALHGVAAGWRPHPRGAWHSTIPGRRKDKALKAEHLDIARRRVLVRVRSASRLAPGRAALLRDRDYGSGSGPHRYLVTNL